MVVRDFILDFGFPLGVILAMAIIFLVRGG